ncbi:MAG TPA: 3'(2'),5'-bisphosphate nucleotidase CysQ [Candidatus Binatia bacterium]|nr:3'(2'),5'-bisphosphate nucleotidase CysQ [Candidatus Binatia bacterium]
MQRSWEAPELRRLVSNVVEIVDTAASRLMQLYDGFDGAVTDKADGSPLTSADVATEEIVVAGLTQISALPIVSEEGVPVAYADRGTWPSFWLVDALDGTREFLERNGEFTINVALIHARRPILGVVSAPALGSTYWAAQGLGAFVRRRDQNPERIAVRADTTLLRVAVSRSHAGTALADFLARLGPHETTPMGSSLKICLLAEGAADLYPRLGTTCEWDIAAAHCILDEAGGTLTGVDGGELEYNKEEPLNPWFFAAASKHVRDLALAAFARSDACTLN